MFSTQKILWYIYSTTHLTHLFPRIPCHESRFQSFHSYTFVSENPIPMSWSKVSVFSLFILLSENWTCSPYFDLGLVALGVGVKVVAVDVAARSWSLKRRVQNKAYLPALLSSAFSMQALINALILKHNIKMTITIDKNISLFLWANVKFLLIHLHWCGYEY